MDSKSHLKLISSRKITKAKGKAADCAAKQVKPEVVAKPKVEINLRDASLYVNRELSWLEFNRRVLEEAQDHLTPVLDKLKFASIFSSNLDEYFMVRVGGLFRIMESDLEHIDPSGRTPIQELNEIGAKARELVAEQYQCLRNEILPALAKAGIFIHRFDELDANEK
jgi:polyphosphate kinase